MPHQQRGKAESLLNTIHCYDASSATFYSTLWQKLKVRSIEMNSLQERDATLIGAVPTRVNSHPSRHEPMVKSSHIEDRLNSITSMVRANS